MGVDFITPMKDTPI